MAVLAVGNAASLAAVDIVSVAKRRIRPIYLVDAAIEIVLIGGWFRLGRASRRRGWSRSER